MDKTIQVQLHQNNKFLTTVIILGIKVCKQEKKQEGGGNKLFKGRLGGYLRHR